MSPLEKFLSHFFDEELVDSLMYLYIFCICYLAIRHVLEHTKLFNATIYEFPIDPAREPIPQDEVTNG